MVVLRQRRGRRQCVHLEARLGCGEGLVRVKVRVSVKVRVRGK